MRTYFASTQIFDAKTTQIFDAKTTRIFCSRNRMPTHNEKLFSSSLSRHRSHSRQLPELPGGQYYDFTKHIFVEKMEQKLTISTHNTAFFCNNGIIVFLENWRKSQKIVSTTLTTSYIQQSIRVARWYIFKPKIPIWVNFGVCCNKRCW
jgi:hypothetical protein